MASRSLHTQNVVREVYQNWEIYVRWYPSFFCAAEGWLCKVIAPGAAAAVNIGRFGSSSTALERGRAWVDQKQRPSKPKARAGRGRLIR